MKTLGGQVAFEYEDDDGLALYVTAKVTDYHPAAMYLRNGDPGYPEEGGEVEDLVVTLQDGTPVDNLPTELLQKLEEQAREELSKEEW